MREVTDRFGRRFTGFRISVTQRCNLSCPHCHREGQRSSSDEMTPEEIGRIIEIASRLGVTKVKITGGEPLLREDICEIVSAARPHVREISLTTNGILVREYARALQNAGLDRMNISIHSLSRERLLEISGRDCLDEVTGGVSAAADAGLRPLKLNMVVLRNINDCEIRDMMAFASQHDAILQLIELASDRSGCNEEYFQRRHYPLEEVEKYLRASSEEIDHNELHRRARYTVRDNGHSFKVELVRSMHNSAFCANCTRLRLSSNGLLKGCLYDQGDSPDILTAIREDRPEEELVNLFLGCIEKRKPYWS